MGWACATAISEILRAAALTDDEAGAVHRRHGEMQREGYRQVVDILAAKGSLRHGSTPESATDVWLTVCGDTTYELLRSERGWSRDQVLDWLQVATPLLLLRPAQGVR